MTDWQLILSVIGAIIGLAITFFGFLFVLMLSLLGYFLKGFHNEYKEDKKGIIIREARTDERIELVTANFSAKLEILFNKFAEKINLLPKGSDGLSQVMLEQERAINKRLDEHSDRIQNNVNRVETVASRVHDLVNAITGSDLRHQAAERRAAKFPDKSGLP